MARSSTILQSSAGIMDNPAGLLLTFEVTNKAVVYVYAGVAGEIFGDQVVFDLNSENLVDTRKAH